MNIKKLFILSYGLGKNYWYWKFIVSNILYVKMYLFKGIKLRNNDIFLIIIVIFLGYNLFGNWLKGLEFIGDE